MYIKVNWIKNETPLSASNLNKMDDEIKKSSDLIGDTDISSIGNGTLTGGLSSVNTTVNNKRGSSDFVVQEFISSSMSVAHGNHGTVNFNIAKDGYKPLGIVGVRVYDTPNIGTASSICNIYYTYLNYDTQVATVLFSNMHDTITCVVTCAINILYVKI